MGALMNKMNKGILVCSFMTIALVFSAALAGAETLKQQFDHQLLVNTPAQSWEHRIDLPEANAQKGLVFTKRNLQLLGRLVIEREEFTPTYYYVKVRLPKHFQEPARGFLNVELEIGNKPVAPVVTVPPTNLSIMDGCAARKPALLWKGEGKYTAITVYDVDAGKTVWERVIVGFKGAEYDEGYLDLHHFKWAVKQSDESGRYTGETQAGFRIENKNGMVVITPE